MKMIKVLFLLGTRPEAIKLAPLIRYFRQCNHFEVKVCSTAQHREMLDQVLGFFQVTTDFDLNVMQPNQSLPDLTAKIIQSFSEMVLSQFKPDWLFVQGDTTTALAGAIAGFYQRVKIGHVEAGLRSQNMDSPFPEEMNRVIISRIAHSHFCPTPRSVQNLALEGIVKNVFQVGNTVIDALLLGKNIMQQTDRDYSTLFPNVDFSKKVILVTCHRRENFGAPFSSICRALRRIVDENVDCLIVYPVHLNPNILNQARAQLQHPRIHLVDPLSYPELLWLLDKSFLVLTDSGGIQEEAPSFNKPVIVLRDVTERAESIDAGTAILAGTSTQKIFDESMRLLTDKEHYLRMTAIANPYGDGKATQRIAGIVKGLS
jgi:UDP-N-acetylglucosamine 2-epimerase (non-hydrolysing)